MGVHTKYKHLNKFLVHMRDRMKVAAGLVHADRKSRITQISTLQAVVITMRQFGVGPSADLIVAYRDLEHCHNCIIDWHSCLGLDWLDVKLSGYYHLINRIFCTKKNGH